MMTTRDEKETKEYPEIMTMQQAQEFLSERGIDCRSRKTFYAKMKQYNIPYIELNPSPGRGKKKYSIRRFRKSDLEKVIERLYVIPEQLEEQDHLEAREEPRKTTDAE